MSETQSDAAIPPFRVGRAMLGILYALIAYGVVIGAAYATYQLAPVGSGMGDLAAGAMVLVLGAGVALLGLLIAGIVALARGKRDTGFGLIIGLAVGVGAAAVQLFPNVF